MTTEISFREAFIVWWKIGILSFGGPAGQIALMHRMIVDEKKWLDEDRFLHALNYCMLLPGPEAQQLATYIGWLLHGVKGGIVAGLMFILPGALAIMIFSWCYVLFADLSIVEGLFFGLKAAVLAIVVQALIRLAKKTLNSRLKIILAVAAFVALFFFGLPFPLVVLSAGLIGFLSHKFNKGFARQNTVNVKDHIPISAATLKATRKAAFTFLAGWLLIVAGVYWATGADNVFTEIAVFFSKMAVVSFGGAYAVLLYVAQQGVDFYHWLLPGEMVDGLGLAETTPGPLILVTQFVGFLAAYREAVPHTGAALMSGTLGALLTTCVTFLPCFFWIFAGAPYIEKIRGNPLLSASLAAITAAVVGVIGNLALWFAINTLFSQTIRMQTLSLDLLLPVLSSLQLAMLCLTALAFVLVFKCKTAILPLLGICSLLGCLWIVIQS